MHSALNPLTDILGRGWLVVLLASFLFLLFIYFRLQAERESYWLHRLAWFIAALVVARGFLLTIVQYVAWSRSFPGRFLLPPYRPWRYFAGYAFFHFHLAYALGIVLAGALVLLLALVKVGRKRSCLRGEEYSVLFIGSVLVRWPLVLPYAGTAFFFSLLWGFLQKYIMKTDAPFALVPWLVALIPPFLLFPGFFMDCFHMQALALPF